MQHPKRFATLLCIGGVLLLAVVLVSWSILNQQKPIVSREDELRMLEENSKPITATSEARGKELQALQGQSSNAYVSTQERVSELNGLSQ